MDFIQQNNVKAEIDHHLWNTKSYKKYSNDMKSRARISRVWEKQRAKNHNFITPTAGSYASGGRFIKS